MLLLLVMQYDNLIIDGNNFLFRSFYSRKSTHKVHGKDTTPLFQTLYMLKGLMDTYTPKKVYFTWDLRLNPDAVNFRRQLVREYKENRGETDNKKEVLSYAVPITELCQTLGIITIFPFDLEGDDVIYYLSKNLEGTSLVVSSDRDLLQMVSATSHHLIPTQHVVVTLENFEEYVGVPFEDFLLYKSIMGDVSDNIPGLKGYGKVKSKIMARDLNLATIEEGEDGFNMAGLQIATKEQQMIINNNMRIIDLSKAIIERPQEYDSYKKQLEEQAELKYDGARFRELCTYYGFHSILRNLGSWKKLFDPDAEFSWDVWLENPTE